MYALCSGAKPNKCNQCDYASCRSRDLRTHLKTHSGEKSNKCNQCDLRVHLKTHSGEKSINATNVTLPALMHVLWGNIWRHIVEKFEQMQPMHCNVTMPLLRQLIWGDIWKRTVEKCHFDAIWGHIWKHKIQPMWVGLFTMWFKVGGSFLFYSDLELIVEISYFLNQLFDNESRMKYNKIICISVHDCLSDSAENDK